MGLLRSVTRSLPAIAVALTRPRLAADVAVERLAAARRELLGAVQAAQPVERGAHDVDGVRRAERLGEDVADAGGLDDGPHRAAGDDAGALRGRLEHDGAGAELLS